MSPDTARELVKLALHPSNGHKYDYIVDMLDFRPKDFTTGYENYPGLHGKYCFYHLEGYYILSINIIKHTVDINTQLINQLYHKSNGFTGLYPPSEKINYDDKICVRDIKINHIFESHVV
jgi:hypothetical protein